MGEHTLTVPPPCEPPSAPVAPVPQSVPVPALRVPEGEVLPPHRAHSAIAFTIGTMHANAFLAHIANYEGPRRFVPFMFTRINNQLSLVGLRADVLIQQPWRLITALELSPSVTTSVTDCMGQFAFVLVHWRLGTGYVRALSTAMSVAIFSSLMGASVRPHSLFSHSSTFTLALVAGPMCDTRVRLRLRVFTALSTLVFFGGQALIPTNDVFACVYALVMSATLHLTQHIKHLHAFCATIFSLMAVGVFVVNTKHNWAIDIPVHLP